MVYSRQMVVAINTGTSHNAKGKYSGQDSKFLPYGHSGQTLFLPGFLGLASSPYETSTVCYFVSSGLYMSSWAYIVLPLSFFRYGFLLSPLVSMSSLGTLIFSDFNALHWHSSFSFYRLSVTGLLRSMQHVADVIQ